MRIWCQVAATVVMVGVMAGPASEPAAAATPTTPYCVTGASAATVTLTGSGGHAQAAAALTGCATTDAPGVVAFRGVPYALPPTGDRRWKAPVFQDLPPSGAYLSYGSRCIQAAAPYTGETGAAPAAPMDEDCLTLNIWSPTVTKAGAAPAPVMVFIYGGAYAAGATTEPYYDAARLAAAGVVAVTLNYRVGALGFMRTDAAGIPGNLGLLDQRAAMTWVKAHIGSFGGDADNITLFGESAGGASTALHTFDMPESAPLFHRGIIESNPFAAQYLTPEQANDKGVTFLESLCKVFQRDTAHHNGQCDAKTNPARWTPRPPTSEEIMEVQGQNTLDMCPGATGCMDNVISFATPWKPVVDGTVVMGRPIDGYYRGPAGTATPKPLLIGVNTDEGAVFPALGYTGHKAEFTPEAFADLLNRHYTVTGSTRSPAELALAYYDPARFPTPYSGTDPSSVYVNGTALALGKVAGDSLFTCGTLTMLDTLVADPANTQPVYGYEFAQPPFFSFYTPADIGVCEPETTWRDQKRKPARYHVCHGNELPYVFDRLESVENASTLFGPSIPYQAGESDHALARTMVGLWVAFARGEMPAWWPRHTHNGRVPRLAAPADATGGFPLISLDDEAHCGALWSKLSVTEPSR